MPLHHRLDARPDAADFRDRLYRPSLVEVPVRRLPDEWFRHGVPVLDQGPNGACTGYALATVAHYLLRTRGVTPDFARVSPQMLYAMARRHDEWPGDDHEGSSCRGAMKGWHKHGVCAEALWPATEAAAAATLTEDRARDARQRPLGAYYRVDHRDLTAMHAALAETGVLLACALVHEGWEAADAFGRIPCEAGPPPQSAHAFAIVGYDEAGWWVQNSWGAGWGLQGCGHLAYADWMRHGLDVWVARLGVPVAMDDADAAGCAVPVPGSRARAQATQALRPHVVSLGNEGRLRAGGDLGTTAADLQRLVDDDLPRMTAGWARPRLVLYAHGGLVSERQALQRLAALRRECLAHECYPLMLVWRTALLATLGHLLQDAWRCRTEDQGEDALPPALGRGPALGEFLRERVDAALEPLVRHAGGRLLWNEMKENARLASQGPAGGAHALARALATRAAAIPGLEIHLVAHSAGSVLQAGLLHLLTSSPNEGGLGLKVASCTLWAPACTMALFDSHFAPALREGRLGRLTLFTLTEQAERDDRTAAVYGKSLLYLVSHALEDRPRVPLCVPEGQPLLGLARDVRAHVPLQALIDEGRVHWVVSPNAKPAGHVHAAGATAHDRFDEDAAVLRATLAGVVGVVG